MTDKLSVDAALSCIFSELAPVSPMRVPVDANAAGCATADTVRAVSDTPRFDCAAMDGYALNTADANDASATSNVRLDLASDIAAQNIPPLLALHHAAPISTGAAIPAGADTILVRERARILNGQLVLSEPVACGLNIRRRGEDIARGDIIVPGGQWITPDAVGALLACGVTHIRVRPPPRIWLIPTGSEFHPPNAAGPDLRYDSNGPMIAAACRALGLKCNLLPPVPDDPAALRDCIAGNALAEDQIVITIGGASGGRYDLVREVIETMRAEILFKGVAMRPGKPVIFARLADGRPFFGLPGNPVAAFVGFRFFVMTAIRRLMGLAVESGQTVVAPVPGRSGITLFLRGYSAPGEDFAIAEDQRSHVMRSVIEANCWIRVDGGEEPRARLFPKGANLA